VETARFIRNNLFNLNQAANVALTSDDRVSALVAVAPVELSLHKKLCPVSRHTHFQTFGAIRYSDPQSRQRKRLRPHVETRRLNLVLCSTLAQTERRVSFI
jgi:outer membrane biogenesis lipoprotein LolB